jgi:two-component system cell cycle response regulator DivK
VADPHGAAGVEGRTLDFGAAEINPDADFPFHGASFASLRSEQALPSPIFKLPRLSLGSGWQSNRSLPFVGACLRRRGCCAHVFRGTTSMTGKTPMPQSADEPRRRKVLIVEDNELNMKLFNDLLAAHGYDTVQTNDGVTALALARLHRPDLILMDIQLPEISGLEVTRRIKEDEDLQRIPVIAVTAFAMKGDRERIRAGGCEDYIAKPISIAAFFQTVERFLS